MSMSYEQFLLIKLAEEASEIAQIALKTAQFGFESINPDTQENNRFLLTKEVNDLYAVVELLEFYTGPLSNRTLIHKKKNKISQYLTYSMELDKVDKDTVPEC